jgi:hypothetical protein
MKYFALGILVTVAVLYPDMTKMVLGRAVDTTNSVVTSVLTEKK